MHLAIAICLGIGLVTCGRVAAATADVAAPLIPAPKQLRVQPGTLALGARPRIVAADPSLLPLATLLGEELTSIAGVQPTIADGHGDAGAIELQLDKTLQGEAYAIDITDRALVRAGNYPALAFATVTLLQAVQNDQGGATLPRMAIADRPDVVHRGLMVDLAREWHPIDTLQQVIRLCRFYKIRHLQLHLSDDQSFTFPSTAYPKLATSGRSYTRAQLDELVIFARTRGVILVPEIDVPAHATAMVRAMPELFKSPADGIINFRDPAVVEAVGRILDEVMDVFSDSPYVHVGADEANLSPLVNDPEYLKTIAELKVGNIHGLFNHFLNQLNARIAARGKRTIAWEGFELIERGPGRVDPSVIVMPFDNYKNVQKTYIPAGHDIINSSWYPLYLVPSILTTPRHIFEWDLYTFGNYRGADPRSYDHIVQYKVASADKVLGAQMCAWEQPADLEIPSLRRRLAAMSERIWNRSTRASYEDFAAALDRCDARLQQLLATGQPDPVQVTASYSIYPDRVALNWRVPAGYPASYTILRGTAPDPQAATVLAESVVPTHYDDTQATAGTDYHYWVRATNRLGTGALTEPARGARGTRTKLVRAYEGFNYPANAGIDGAAGGNGWAGAWRVDKSGAQVRLARPGLTYPGLRTGPGSLNIRFVEEKEGLVLTRDTVEPQGVEGSELWVSFLIRANKIGAGHAFIQPASSNLAIGKKWGNGLCIDGRSTPYAMEPGRTYLLVARYLSMKGADVGYVWVNPPLNREPSVDDAGVAGKTGDLGSSPTLRLNFQQHGMGDYDLDEIRIGHTWQEVLPRQ